MSVSVMAGVALRRREMRAIVLGPGRPIVISLYLGALALVAAQFLVTHSNLQAHFGLPLGVQLFDRLALAQLALITLLAPLAAANAVSAERRRNSWDLILIAPASSLGIVSAKLAPRIASLLSLLVLSLPIVALSWIYGGVTFRDVLPAYVVLAVTSLVLTICGLLISIVTPRPVASLISAAVLEALWVGIVALLSRPALRAGFELDHTSTLHTTLLQVISPLAALDAALPARSFLMHGGIGQTVWPAYLAVAVAAALVLLVVCVGLLRPASLWFRSS